MLDTHGDVVYATRDHARDLYAFTNEWRYSTDHSAISSDWVREYRFINVTTGEFYWGLLLLTRTATCLMRAATSRMSTTTT